MDSAIEYKSLIHKIENKLKNYELLGFDVSTYKEQFKIIIYEVENNSLDSKKREIGSKMFLTQDYLKGINSLKHLNNELEGKYEIYFMAGNVVKYVDIKVDDKLVGEELDKLVSRMITVLKSLLNSEVFHYDEEKNVIESFYKVAYKLIKYEYIANGKSELFEYIKNSDINSSYITKYIEDDISMLNLDDEKNKILRKRIYEVQMDGSNNTLFDSMIIKLLLLYDENVNLKEVIETEFKEAAFKLLENNNDVKSNSVELNYILSRINQREEEYIESKKSVKKRIIALITACSVVIGSGIAMYSPAKKRCTYKEVEVQSIVYSELDGYEKIDIEQQDNQIKEYEVYVRVYEPSAEKDFIRFRQYNLSNVDFEDPKQYFDYDLSNLTFDIVEEPINKDVQNKALPDEPYKEVLINRYSYGEEYIVYGRILMVYSFYAMLAIALEVMGLPLILKNAKNLHEELDSMNESGIFYINNLEKLQSLVDKCMNLINSDKELRIKFNKFYEENKYLLDNPKELFNKVKESEEDVKKLVKKLDESKNYKSF